MARERFINFLNQSVPDRVRVIFGKNEEREVRLKKTGPLLLARTYDNQLEPVDRVNIKRHKSFTPAMRIELKTDRLVGQSFPFVFQFSIDSEENDRIYEIPTEHEFRRGVNVIFPSIAIPTESIARGGYNFKVLVPADIVFDRLDFVVHSTKSVSATVGKDGVFEFDEIDPKEVSVQDIVDMLEQ